eukprot:TRINITY_DN10467_c0_g1_i1.p1 TRINITY_DN10467_c0_g1~~TRINITY_DN10467_c0_g1_i1.p1  ORF type:complete len:390 (-),score=56.63 TRINITY_DN10467_c0_g1_i1:60-1229(-)
MPGLHNRRQMKHQQKWPWWRLVLICVYALAANAELAAVFITLLPLQVKNMVSAESKGTVLGIVVLLGSLTSAIAAPTFGHWSDMRGKRKPFMVAGVLLSCLCKIPMALSTGPGDIYYLIVGWVLVSVFNSLCMAPYSALIPDLIMPDQRGTASGWMGILGMLGFVLGGAIFGLIVPSTGHATIYALISALNIVCLLVTILAFKETPQLGHRRKFQLKQTLYGCLTPFQNRNFVWVFATRFLYSLGNFTMQEFIQFYFGDVVSSPYTFGVISVTQPAQAASVFLIFLLVGAVASSVPSGKLSDIYGRKVIVYVSGAMHAIVMVLFMFVHDFSANIWFGIVLGVGYGAYQTVDWGLATDVMPSARDYARDMSLWSLSYIIPQSTSGSEIWH